MRVWRLAEGLVQPVTKRGLAYLIAVLWLDARTAIALSAALSLLVAAIRLGLRGWLRGVKGGAPSQTWAEITYPTAGTVSLAVGWGLLGDRWLAFGPIAFMTLGDSLAGLARDASIQRGREMRVWPSVAMLGACLAAAALFHTYWMGALGL